MALKGKNCGDRSLGEKAEAVTEGEGRLKEKVKPGGLEQNKLET